MFYDYFDELPEVIDDDNQETYYALTSLKNDNDVLDDKLNSMERETLTISGAPLIDLDAFFQYFCAVCGKTILLTNFKVENCKKRTTDDSFAIPEIKNQENPVFTFYKKELEKSEEMRICNENKSSSEIRQFYSCADCDCLLAYQVDMYPFLFVLNDSLVIDLQFVQLVDKISEIPNYADSKINEAN